MPGPFAPDDSLVGPIAHQIALLIKAQIPSISGVYETLPDQAPGDNTVMLPMTKAKVLGDTNGKMKILFTYTISHLFRRSSMSSTVSRAYTYVMPWMNFLSAWANQNLNGLAIQVSASDITIGQKMESGQPMVGVFINVLVLTEFNIPLT